MQKIKKIFKEWYPLEACFMFILDANISNLKQYLHLMQKIMKHISNMN